MHLFTQQFELNQPEKSLYTQSNETVCICPCNVSLGEEASDLGIHSFPVRPSLRWVGCLLVLKEKKLIIQMILYHTTKNLVCICIKHDLGKWKE